MRPSRNTVLSSVMLLVAMSVSYVFPVAPAHGQDSRPSFIDLDPGQWVCVSVAISEPILDAMQELPRRLLERVAAGQVTSGIEAILRENRIETNDNGRSRVTNVRNQCDSPEDIVISLKVMPLEEAGRNPPAYRISGIIEQSGRAAEFSTERSGLLHSDAAGLELPRARLRISLHRDLYQMGKDVGSSIIGFANLYTDQSK